MKTSVIEVHDMLSVLSVQGVEERIGEVPGVESVTVNFSAGNATVRYDETRLDISDVSRMCTNAGTTKGPLHPFQQAPATQRWLKAPIRRQPQEPMDRARLWSRYLRHRYQTPPPGTAFRVVEKRCPCRTKVRPQVMRYCPSEAQFLESP